MSDEPGVDDDPAGLPIAELRTVNLAVDDAFTGRVRQSINRHLLAGDLLELAWRGPCAAALELIEAALSWFHQGPRDERT
jgi:hypothetical protein